MHDLRALTKPLLIVVGGSCALVASQPDMGTAMVLAFTAAAMLIAAGMPLRKLAIVFAAGAWACACCTRSQALRACAPDVVHRSLGACVGQRLSGRSGSDRDRLRRAARASARASRCRRSSTCPEAPTDFILAVIGEELGAIGVCALLFLYGLIAYAGLRVARGARSLHSALVAVGVTSLIVSQAILNVFAVLGLAPLTGVPLPFVSYGSSSMIVMLAAMGLLLNVAGGASVHVRERHAEARSLGRRAGARTGDDGTVTTTSGSQTKIVIAAGGTAGHVVPALAVALALRAEGADVGIHRWRTRRGAARARRGL